MISKYVVSWLAVLGLPLLPSGWAVAAIVAQDTAADPAYADGWTLDDNGGTGFLPWSGAGNYGGGPMDIDLGPDALNDLGSPAFRTGPGFQGFLVRRQFQNPLQVGQSFSIDFDAYPIFPTGGDILISFGAEDGDSTPEDKDERFSLYAYYYNDGTFEFGSDFWGINAETASDNLAGGASLPDDPLGGIYFRSTYTTTDASDGFSLTFDLLTVDTYRLRIFDDDVTKLDVSGQLFNFTAGELINQVSIYGSTVTDSSFEQMVYFNNMKIESATGQAGDFNSDGNVDGRDFLVWQRNTAVGSLADWQNNYGAGGLAAISAVPEPTAFSLCSMALVVATSAGRRLRVR